MILKGGSRVFVSSVGLIRRQQSSVHGLHAGRAGEGPHQPVVYAVHVVGVHAGQEPDGISINKVHHADDTPVEENPRFSGPFRPQ